MDSLPESAQLTAGEMHAPVVTVVMANYNGSAFIAAALQSVLRGSLSQIEVIVADDASTDDSVQRVAAIARTDPRVRLMRTAGNGGPGAARNLCLDAARGRWIAVLDSDDLMHPERLQRLVAAAERDDADIVADDLLIFDVDPRVPPRTCLDGAASASPFWITASDYVRANTLFSGRQALGYLKPLIRASLIRDSGLRYDPGLRIAEDYDFILRLLLWGARFRVYPELGYFYRKHSSSISHRLSHQTLLPMLAAHESLQKTLASRDSALNAAMAGRAASLRRALAFEDLVRAVKRHAWADVLRQLARRPRLLPMLGRAVSERLQRAHTTSTPSTLPSRPQVCVLSRQRVIGRTNGSSVYLLALCSALNQAGCDLHLLWPSPAVFGRWPLLRLHDDMRVFRSIRLRRSVRIGPLLLATDPGTLLRAAFGALGRIATRLGVPAGRLDQPAPYAIAQQWSRADQLFVARHARGADCIIADYAFLTEGIPFALCPDALSLVVMHDLFSSRAEQFARLNATDSVAALDRTTEMALLAKADVVVAIQEEEARIVSEHLPAQHVLVAPMAAEPVGAAQPGRGRTVLFVGSNTAPNVLAMQWVFQEVWPVVSAAVPDAALHVAGSVCRALPSAPAGVQLLGPVDDLPALYREAAVVISPLQTGSGLKIKLVEALGHGKAVVATSVTMQGVKPWPADAVTVADEAENFAAGVIELLRDPQVRMTRARAALALARERFAPAACYGGLVELVLGAGRATGLTPGP